MNRGSFEGVDGGPELAPGDPYLLCCGIHDDPLIVTCPLISNDITVQSLWGDLTVLLSKYVCHARVSRWLNVFVEKEDSVELRIRLIVVVRVILVIIEVHIVCCVIHTSECVVW